MIEINITDLIPKTVRQKAVDATVDFVVNLGKGYLSDEITRRIKKLRSDGEFQSTFEDGLQQAVNRFIEEYVNEDEDLVEAITTDKTFFQNEDVQKALLAILKKPGIYSADEQEIVISSFDSVLPQRRNRKRVNKAVTYFLKCLAEEVWNLPELRPIYELQFQRMTAEAVREQVTIQKAQLQTSVALSTDIRDALLQLTDAVAERKLLSSGDELHVTPVVRHNLPQPDYERFIGRKAELREIRRLLSPKTRHFIVTIDGIGGVGKSTLALEVANSYLRYYDELPSEERFEAIIWTTAKQTTLTGEGIITRPQALRTLDDIYTTIAIALEREDIARAHPDKQDDLIRRIIVEQRTLLIVDNLETVDDESVLTFIREIPAPTKVIVTTRHRVDIAYPIRLTGMPEDDALDLIDDEAKLKKVKLADEQYNQLYLRTGGVPLAIVWSIAQMGFGYGVDSVLNRLGQPTSDIARFCFEGAVERIRANKPYKLLLALSLFVTDASRDALGDVSDLSVLDRDDGLVDLEKLSLVNKHENRFYLLPLTKNFISKEENYESSKFRQRYIQYFAEFCQRQIGTQYWDGLSYDGSLIEPELENIFLAINWAFENSNWKEVQYLFIGVVHLLATSPAGALRRLDLAEKALLAAQKLDDTELEAWIHIDTLGFSLKFLDRQNEALSHIKTGKIIAKEAELVDCLAVAEISLAQFALESHEIDVALQHIENAFVQAESPVIKARVHQRRAKIYALREEWEKAEESALFAADLSLKSGAVLDEAIARNNLGQIYLKLRNLDSAEKAFLRSQQLGYKYNWLLTLGDSMMGLAEVSYTRQDFESTYDHIEQARNLYEQLGREDRLQKLNALSQKLSN